ncbi:PH domain-containing protein [Sphingorhabdus arenilitoris]|uniref:PH domain-containing protein n=1 Tax=Sphingorhabdus arenilitoris TaxID=1490041 RepID=A0ABV8RDX2_9SPHN
MTEADIAPILSDAPNAPQSGDALTPIDPRDVPVTRIGYAIMMVPLMIGAGVLEIAQLLPPGVIFVPVLLLSIFLIFIFPPRQYRRWGYHMAADRIRIVRGYMFYSDTVVPFGRVQHIDVSQGPIERQYGIATLTLHTAGNYNSSVHLPSLAHEDALALREEIRAHIKRDTL